MIKVLPESRQEVRKKEGLRGLLLDEGVELSEEEIQSRLIDIGLEELQKVFELERKGKEPCKEES